MESTHLIALGLAGIAVFMIVRGRSANNSVNSSDGPIGNKTRRYAYPNVAAEFGSDEWSSQVNDYAQKRLQRQGF